MDWINYHHLLYFWTVAREGSIAKACVKLHLSQPTVSAQLRLLERSLREKLFEKQGRGLVLTDVGQVVYRYAEEIFSLGREMIDTVKGRPTGKPLRLVVGIADIIPKLIAHQLLAPALQMPEPVQLVCYEDRTEQLLADLSLHRLDFVISDAPIPPSIRVRAFSHPLGDCAVAVFATPRLARRYRREFPRSLDQAPFLLPLGTTMLRKSLEAWFESHNIRPQIAGEFADSALLKVFGKAGTGLFVGPAAIAADICRQFNVQVIGTIPEVRESFYSISPERRLRHPAIVAVLTAARKHLFK